MDVRYMAKEFLKGLATPIMGVTGILACASFITLENMFSDPRALMTIRVAICVGVFIGCVRALPPTMENEK